MLTRRVAVVPVLGLGQRSKPRELLDAFAVTGTVPDGPVLLVDDVRGSGWTLTTIAGLLRDSGAGPVHPLALLSGRPASADARPRQGE